MSAKDDAAKPEPDMRLRISGLVEQISCGETRDCREDARTQLLAIGRPAVPALVEAVRVEKGAARLEMARLLRQMADPASAVALVELLSDADFDVRWEAVEALSALGYDGLAPLVAAIIQRPGSLALRNGAHHILHHIAAEGYYELLKPLMMAIEGAIPNVEIPAAARQLLAELSRA
jgi:HEAT repeat protein